VYLGEHRATFAAERLIVSSAALTVEICRERVEDHELIVESWLPMSVF
jgi:hypothetical protein